MRNVVPSRALVRRSRQLLQFALLAITAGIFFALVGMAFYAVPLFSTGSTLYSIFDFGRAALFYGGIVLVIVGGLMVARAFTWKTENDLARQTGETLAPLLDERYTFIRNISKRQLGYIDAALVGPPGILVLRIVDYQGHFLNEAGKWLKADKKGRWKPMRANPTQDVVKDIQALRRYLAARNLPDDLPVFGIVVFVKDDPIAHLTLKEPVVRATHLSSLHNRLQSGYLAQDRIEPGLAAAVVRLLYGE
jgi:hypothetical protein